MSICIAIVGDFNPHFLSHRATNTAMAEVAKREGLDVQTDWVSTTVVENIGPERALDRCHAVFASPGSPYRSFQGMLRAIEYARVLQIPFAGT